LSIINKQNIVILLLFITLMFSVVFFGGLYWQHSIIPMCLLTVALIISNKKELSLFHTVFLSASLLLLAVSLIITNGDFQTGLYETEKLFLFYLAFLLGRNIDENKLYYVFVFTALVTSVAGILVYCGVFDVSEFVFVDRTFIRLQSFFRYANSAACFLGVGYFAFLKVWKDRPTLLMCICGMLILLSFYLTFSKACVPILVVTGTFLVFKEKRLRNLFVVQNTVVLIFCIAVMLSAKSFNMPLAVVLSAVCVALGAFLCMKLHSNKINFFYVWLAIVIFVCIFCVCVLIYKPSLLSTFISRMVYSKESLALLKENPLFGCGTAAWRVMQYSVQSSYYHVTYLHNGWTQFAVENGILFFLCFLSLVVYSLIKALKEKKYILFSAILLVCLHSAFDFNLSLASILIVFGILVGSASVGDYVTCAEAQNVNFKIGKAFYVVFVMISVLMCIYTTGEYCIRKNFESKIISGENESAYKTLKVLERVCPFDSNIKSNLAALEQRLGNDESVIVNYLRQAHELSPYDSDLFLNYVRFTADNDNIAEYCEKLINLAPKNENLYIDIKQLLSEMLENGCIEKQNYDMILQNVENRRLNEWVVDRNTVVENLMLESIKNKSKTNN